ncbi:MAG: hypothetical protein ACTHKT_06405 [Solirubrobacterales bacterium]
MPKKLLIVCGALVLFAALALPAVAFASPVLTENGVAVAAGQKFIFTQLGTSKMTSTDGTRTLLECSTGMITGELIKNTGTEIEGKITSDLFGGTGAQAPGEPKPECTGEAAFGNFSRTAVVSEKAPWCVKTINPPKDEFTIVGGNCGGVASNIKFIIATTLVGNCELETTGHLVGTYTTNGTSAVLTLNNTAHGSGVGEGSTNGFKKIAGSAFCPSSGSYDMSFTLETDEATVKPLTIS